MKFVRWLGAFRVGSTIDVAAEWEHSQTERQVAVEPLWRGQSLIRQARIGLVVDNQASRFHAGWLTDAWTENTGNGVLRPKHRPRDRQGRKFRDPHRFLAAWSRIEEPTGWAEAIFDQPRYCAVVVKSTATEHGRCRAARLATNLNLPLEVLPSNR